MLVIVIVAVLCMPSPQPQFTWLTPAQAAQANRPGLLTQLKYKLIRLAGPLMRYYHQNRPSIMISVYILAQPAKLGETAPDAPAIASSNGQSAWILSPDELFLFRQRLKANPDVVMLSSPRILTASGLMVRSSMLQSANGLYTNVGSTIDTVATASGNSINLLVNAIDTQLAGPLTIPPPPVVTNLSAVCRARIADAGGLVISSGKTLPAGPTNCWLIISPMFVDAAGKPIKK